MINDPRGMQGILSRGSNTYNAGSKSSYGGKVTTQSLLNGGVGTYKKMSLQDVARKALGGNGTR